MSIIGNILWIVLGGGLALFLEYLLGGVGLCLTIVGIPFGVQAFKLSLLALLPFGKEIVPSNGCEGRLAVFLNVIWIICGGFWIALTHLIFGILCAVTIIGIPFAVQHMKLATLALTPFGHTYRVKEAT